VVQRRSGSIGQVCGTVVVRLYRCRVLVMGSNMCLKDVCSAPAATAAASSRSGGELSGKLLVYKSTDTLKVQV
jgi:hypothetical protein